jgi:hypothetical protein
MHKSQIHPSVLKLPKSATFNVDDVLSWLKTNKEKLPELRRLAHKTPRIDGAMAEFKNVQGYITMINHYLRHGDWISDYFGANQERRTQWKRIA